MHIETVPTKEKLRTMTAPQQSGHLPMAGPELLMLEPCIRPQDTSRAKEARAPRGPWTMQSPVAQIAT